MTPEELYREGIIAGLCPAELWEMTCGEVAETVRAFREGERRRMQQCSIIAWEQAALTARALAGEPLPEVWEVFPFWEEEEIRAQKVEHYRAVMERYVDRGKGQFSVRCPESADCEPLSIDH